MIKPEMMNMAKKSLIAFVICLVIIGTACRKAILAPNNPSKTKLLNLVNSYRAAGCTCGTDYYPAVGPIVWNDTLETAAKVHSDDMNAKQYFSHTGSDGSNTGDRLTRLKYIYYTYGENIAEGYSNEEDVMAGWIKSPGHCRNIMDGNFTQMGLATNGKYWTQVFSAH